MHPVIHHSWLHNCLVRTHNYLWLLSVACGFTQAVYNWSWVPDYINGLVQERRNSIADALELRLSCTNPSIWALKPLGSIHKNWCIFIPPLNEVERGVYWNEIVRLSVCTPQSPLTLSWVQFFSDRGQTW